MNRKMIVFTIGQIMVLAGVLMILPLAVSLIYSESCWSAFAVTIVGALLVGGLIMAATKNRNKNIYAREGFVIVALAWLVMSAVGALPFVISGEIPSFVDAFFETVSGFTTTGASIVNDVESLSHGILFWRSFTHWVGGMGVLVLVMVFVSTDSGRYIHILRAEMPGPTMGKLVPKLSVTAKILYILYICLTAAEVVMLLLGGMPLFDSLVHAFGTAGTGGFGIKADSIAGYSPYLQWVIAVFMLIFGVNFNIYYLMIIRRFRSAFRSGELWCYIGIVGAASAIITANIYPLYSNLSDAIRNSFFQISSIITTTGYSTADFNLWPTASKMIIFLLMFMGGCAGSTAGGLKVSRIMLLAKLIRRNLRHMLHPRSVSMVSLEGKRVEKDVLDTVGTYFSIYIGLYAVVLLLISFDVGNFETHISAAATCLNNVGPGFAGVGPMSNFAVYSPFSKFVLSFAMLFGRLELYPLLLLFMPSVWRKCK